MADSGWIAAPWVYLVNHPTFKTENITPLVELPAEFVRESELEVGQKLTFKIELRRRFGYQMRQFEDVCVDRLGWAGGRYLLRLDPTPMHEQLQSFIYERVSNSFKSEKIDVAARILDDVELRLKLLSQEEGEGVESEPRPSTERPKEDSTA